MDSNKLELGQFICWEHGENYPFSACMAKLIELLGGDTSRFTYGFFAGLSGDDFIMCYADNGECNDCVSVCENTERFLKRTFNRIGLKYEYVPVKVWKMDREALKAKLRDFIDRGIPVLTKDEQGMDGAYANYDLLYAYESGGERVSRYCGDPKHNQDSALDELKCSFIFIDSLPVIDDLAKVYRESVLQLPEIMKSKTETGVLFGANAYRAWADDLENGRYDRYTGESFESWRDWCVYVCNLATNARHGWDFIAKAYVHNPDMPNILHMISLLDRNERQLWHELEEQGFGFNVTLENLQNREKRLKAAETIRRIIPVNEEIERLF